MDIIFAKSSGIHSAVKLARTEPRHYGRRGEVLRSMLPDVREQVAGDVKDPSPLDHVEAQTQEVGGKA